MNYLSEQKQGSVEIDNRWGQMEDSRFNHPEMEPLLWVI